MEWNLITSFLSGILGSILVQAYVKGGINNFYNKKLESFKNDLIIETETRKFEFDKKIHDFSIYSSKRHEIYPDLYSRIKEIELIFPMMKEKSYIPIESTSNIQSVMEYYGGTGIIISDKQVDKIKKIVEKEYLDQEEYLDEIKNSMYQYLIFIELEKVRSLNIFLNKMELYFSEDVSKITESLLSEMLYLITVELGVLMETNNLKTTDNSKIITETESLKKQLKLEMSLGY